MQNTILIHAPGRRQGRGALVLAYTALFALLMGIWAAIFALNGQSFIQYGDTLKQHYPFLVYYGRWLRQAARCVLTGAAVPTWDFSIGYGADIITTLSYYGLGDPLDLLAAFVPGRWTEQLLEGLIVLRLYLAGLAFMAFSRRHGNSRFGTLLGALAYVFSAWPIQAGLIEPVFLVPMYCFPLMLLGADDLFEGRSPVLYIAAIALTALSNFLFFYMAAVLLVLYAIAVYSKRYGAKNLRTLPPLLAKFIGFALVGIAISAVTLLPTAQELFGSARFGLTRETAPYPFYRFFELLANMTTGMGYDAYSTYAGVTSAAFLGVLVLFAKPRQNTVLKCAWLGLLALLLVPQAGSVLNGISYVSNRWVWAFTMLEAFILARVCPGITAFEPKEKRNLFALLAVYCVVAFCVKQGRTETALLGALLLVLLAETMFLYNYTRSYYNSVQQTMYRRFSSVSGQLKMYTGDTVQSTAATRSVALRRMVEQFADKDKYEFMLLDSYGGVIASSSGTNADGIVTGIDFEQAQEASDGLGVAVYRTQSGELVMAACYLVPYAAEDVAAMRLVTSLTLVGAQIKNALAVSVVIAAVILAFTVMSGLYFIRSIVVPLGQVERTAASIARGELDVRLPVTGNEHDEVDRLRGTINQMAEGLEETEKMKNEFISSVSHELRTPLTSIRGWVETLRTLDDPADENYRKGLEIINNETGRLYNMVEELLDFSRLQNGRIRMDCRPLDLVAELTDAVLFCEARIQREGLVLSYTEPEEMIPVYADPDRLRQVFINIMDNAIKYSAPGGRITVKLWAGEYKAFAEIIDQGRGIPPEDLENVKTKFYKGSNSVRGSGIGLALVDSIMTALDGTMDLKSTLGRGTVVTLGLPIYKR